MRQGALDTNRGPRKCAVLEAYPADAWIAATALVISAPPVTNNPKDYRHLENLQIVSASAG